MEDLERKLKEAVESVRAGVGAVLDAHLDGPEGKFNGYGGESARGKTPPSSRAEGQDG